MLALEPAHHQVSLKLEHFDHLAIARVPTHLMARHRLNIVKYVDNGPSQHRWSENFEELTLPYNVSISVVFADCSFQDQLHFAVSQNDTFLLQELFKLSDFDAVLLLRVNRKPPIVKNAHLVDYLCVFVLEGHFGSFFIAVVFVN